MDAVQTNKRMRLITLENKILRSITINGTQTANRELRELGNMQSLKLQPQSKAKDYKGHDMFTAGTIIYAQSWKRYKEEDDQDMVDDRLIWSGHCAVGEDKTQPGFE